MPRFSVWAVKEMGPMTLKGECELRRDAVALRQKAKREGATQVFQYDGVRLDKIGVHIK